jgi:protein TonB
MKNQIRIVGICLIVMAGLIGHGCTTAETQGGVAPVAVFQARPVYPFEMARAGIQGEVVVAFIVDKEGIPRELHAQKSSNPAFEGAAIAAVAKWRFRPGTFDGKPVNTGMSVPIVFSLEEIKP